MINRRKFLSNTVLVSIGAMFMPALAKADSLKNLRPLNKGSFKAKKPLVISTWNHGLEANEAAWKILQKGGKALDAVEQGVKVTEADPNSHSVGYGGLPDRDGNVTLDACIMEPGGNCGSVCFLQNIKHPISVARKVMEDTPHVILAGDGALKFALEKGFKKENLLTEKAKKEWEKWKKKSKYSPVINSENHDTIGMLAIDENNDIAGACTTSGAAYKLHGRVGDSPIIGAGLYVDNEVGGAVATGMGELVLKTLGTFLVVELMRNGKTPQQACEEAVNRIAGKLIDYKDFQVGYLAIDKKGNIGSYCINKGFDYALYSDNENKLLDSDYFVK